MHTHMTWEHKHIQKKQIGKFAENMQYWEVEELETQLEK